MPLPSRNLQPMDRIAPRVSGLRTTMVNLYAVSNPDGSWVLVDTGLYFAATKILRWVEEQFGPGAKPECIVLTHGHFDHVGSIKELLTHWDVPVYAHALERPYLAGKAKYPPPDATVGKGVFSLFAPIYPRGPIDLGDRLHDLPRDGSVPNLEGWRAIPTPGHSPGHVSFFRDEDRVLLAGDAFVTTKQESFNAVVTQRPEIHGPPAYYTMDWDAAKLSVGRLADLQPNVVACGHGLPMDGPEVVSALEYLAQHFDEIARPARGRYVREPAIVNENGIVRLPPPVVSPVVKIAAAAVIAGGFLYVYSQGRRSRS